MLEEAAWTPPEEFDEYRIIRPLGRGSMGAVYLAHDVVLDRPVAVKFLGALRPDPLERERFLVEARAIARIHHPNVMSIFRAGEIRGRLYLVTEYVRGESLADLALPLAIDEVIRIGIGLARGLAAAHRQGVLHRDIKLSNAVVDRGGEVKLLDFGLAKLLDGVSEALRPASASGSRPVDESTADNLMRAAASVRQMVSQRLADTMRIETPSATAPTPKVENRSGKSDEEKPKEKPKEKPEEKTPDGAYDRERFGAWHSDQASITRAGTVMGTPHYMAPELWLSDPASRRSDVYALGVLLYILCLGEPPHDAESPFELAMQVQERPAAPLRQRLPTVDPRLAAIVDRCLAQDPYERYATGDELRGALEQLRAPARARVAAPTGNPYRGLQAFEAEHRSLFFGRSAEVRAVVERLRADSFVVVAGDSGVGKSSLCRAGVVPAVLDGDLEPSKRWRTVTMTPGRYPRQSFVAVIARAFELGEDEVSRLVREEPEALVRVLRRQLGETGGCLIFLDQFEEFVTIAEAAEVAVIGPMIVRLLAGIPGLRVLATVRGDFLTRVVTVPGLGDEVARGIYLLRPLSPEGAREAIVGPAEVHDVTFESDALIEELVEAGVEGSLPLLQFALAELWESRDPSASVITEAELRKIGGVSGALARHADGVLASLLPDQRSAARRLLMRLVTLDNTRASLTEEELVASDEASKAALDALVRGRLLVVREAGERMVFEIAHEALVGGWAQLAGWLDDEKEARAARHRLEQAAAEWARLGQGRVGLWSAEQVTELQALDLGTLREREQAFLSRSASEAHRARQLRRAVIVVVPLVLVAVYAGMWVQQRRDTARKVQEFLDGAAVLVEEASRDEERSLRLREEAFQAFDSQQSERAEELWAEFRSLSPEARRTRGLAAQQLETAYGLDPAREDVRAHLADTILAQIRHAEALGERDSADELRARLRIHDPELRRLELLDIPAELTVETTPAGAEVLITEITREPDGRRTPGEFRPLGATPLLGVKLARGDYLLSLRAAGHEPVRQPITVVHGEVVPVRVALPAAGSVPEGFVYVPAGRFLFGVGVDDDTRRMVYSAVPIHLVATDAYMIARNETTFAEYIRYLEALPAEEREVRRPQADGIELRQEPDSGGQWTLKWSNGPNEQLVRVEERLLFSREPNSRIDWLNMPVLGLSAADAEGYVAWLSTAGGLPGARFCTGYEWERAARGADDRMYPHSDVLRPQDANFDLTYGKDTAAMAPEEIGRRPGSTSPFGVDDMAGNAYEWVRSSVDPGAFELRGGSYFLNGFMARTVIRERLDPAIRSRAIGLRVCATYR